MTSKGGKQPRFRFRRPSENQAPETPAKSAAVYFWCWWPSGDSDGLSFSWRGCQRNYRVEPGNTVIYRPASQPGVRQVLTRCSKCGATSDRRYPAEQLERLDLRGVQTYAWYDEVLSEPAQLRVPLMERVRLLPDQDPVADDDIWQIGPFVPQLSAANTPASYN